jgi:tetratricopeptide (TPR) repeat protein
MENQLARDAVEVLIRQAGALYQGGRYRESQRAAEAAVEAAQRLGAIDLEIRANEWLAGVLNLLGDPAAALAKLTWNLGVAQDATHARALDNDGARWSVATAWMDWVQCARFLPDIEVGSLFRVLSEGEAWLRSVGLPHWRAGLLSQRASLLEAQGRFEEALGFAEEALALERRHPGAPGYTLATYRRKLGDLLRQTGRDDEALPHYQGTFDDPGATENDHFAAHVGIARCALARVDPPTALRHAREAVALAERLGDEALCPSLSALTDACRAAGQRDEARLAATRNIDAARRPGSNLRLYFALRARLDVALDDGDVAVATPLLTELEPLAQILDRQTGTTTATTELAQRRARFEALRPSR